jgi:hypothetical protein
LMYVPHTTTEEQSDEIAWEKTFTTQNDKLS